MAMTSEQRQARWPTAHGGVFLAALGVTALFLPATGWPWYLVMPLATYGAVVLLIPALRRTVPVPPAGRLTGPRILAAIVLSAATSGVLLAYQALVAPDVTGLGAYIPVAAFGSLALAWVCFTLVNAVLEELVFRGVLYEALTAEWGAAVAVAATALAFGLGHLHGYPPGPLGTVLAGLYGVALGLLRWWTGGLALPTACHACADATIFGILASAGAFEVSL
jgi:membrane protease YdiL (CAAX protease family)